MNNDNVSVLFAEDDDITRENAVEYLQSMFENVYEAKDGLEALSLYNKHPIDIIISDIQMPKINGLELIERIRQKDNKTQIIITSAFSTKEYLLRAVELQLVKYLIKPISEQSLNQALQQCCQMIKQEQSNVIAFADGFTFDCFNQILVHEGELIKLRTKEIALLELLLKNQQRFVTYSEIEHVVWAGESMSKDALKTLIRDLKNKLSKKAIVNLSGTGYKIAP